MRQGVCLATEVLYTSESQFPGQDGDDKTHLADVEKIRGDNVGVGLCMAITSGVPYRNDLVSVKRLINVRESGY